MANIGDFVGSSENIESDFKEISISVLCPECDREPNYSLYSKERKKIKTICDDHEAVFDMNLSWLHG